MNHLTDYKHRVSSIEHPASPLTHSPIHKIRDTRYESFIQFKPNYKKARNERK